MTKRSAERSKTVQVTAELYLYILGQMAAEHVSLAETAFRLKVGV